jgi:hypothetical protein
MTPHVSYTALECWRECQWRWKLDYLEERRSETYGIYKDFGTCIHRTAERLVVRNGRKSIGYPKKHFERLFRFLYRHNSSLYPERDRKIDVDSMVEAGLRIVDDLLLFPELAESTVIRNEYELIVPIHRTDGVEVNFKGYIDLLVLGKDGRGKSVLYVCDYKTCSWGWDRQKIEDKKPQLLLYKHFLCKQLDLDPEEARVAFIFLKRRPGKDKLAVEWKPVSAGPTTVQRALDDVNRAITEMVVREGDGSFKKNRNACINDYGDICPYMGTELCP